MKRFLCLLTALFTSFSMLTSCGSETDNSNQTTGPYTGATSSVQTTEEDRSMLDDLGEFNFNGYEFKMFSENNSGYCNSNLNFTEETGELINDAIYLRNRTIEERFNFTFKEIVGSNGTADANAVRASISAGDDAYDIVTLHMTRTFPMAMDGLLHPVSALPHIDLTKDYWFKDLNNSITVANYKFFATGMYDLTTYDYTHLLLFNKTILSDNELEDPYKLVKSDNWTFDKYSELAKAATKDLNGDGIFDGSDRYGLVSRSNITLPAFWSGAGLRTVEKDASDIPYLNVGKEAFITVISKAFEITWDNNSWYTKSGTNQSDSDKMFLNNQGLFLESSLFFIDNLRAMETDFGILPFPKYSKSQENYYCWTSCTPAVVPITADSKALERASVILEAMSCESMKTVIPAVYEVALMARHTRDEESADMLNIIFENLLLDWGISIWDTQIRNGLFSPMFAANDRNLVSKVEALDEVIKKLSESMVEAFKDIK